MSLINQIKGARSYKIIGSKELYKRFHLLQDPINIMKCTSVLAFINYYKF